MLFVRNTKDPIYNSLSDLKSGILINEWFNLSVYDESTILQTAQEIESILKKIPEMNRFKNHEITPIQLLAVFYFIVTVAITHKIVDSYLAAIDSSILGSPQTLSTRRLQGIVKHAHMLKPVLTLPSGHPKMSMPRLPQNTASTTMDTKFTPWLIPYHILLWDSLSQPQVFTIIPCLSLS